jgi:hypothetical protein
MSGSPPTPIWLQLRRAEEFANNLEQARHLGYDADVLERIRDAGPAQTHGLLAALVRDPSLVETVNGHEARFREVTSAAAEAARRLIDRAPRGEDDDD